MDARKEDEAGDEDNNNGNPADIRLTRKEADSSKNTFKASTTRLLINEKECWDRSAAKYVYSRLSQWSQHFWLTFSVAICKQL